MLKVSIGLAILILVLILARLLKKTKRYIKCPACNGSGMGLITEYNDSGECPLCDGRCVIVDDKD